jgi:hypothetical protein
MRKDVFDLANVRQAVNTDQGHANLLIALRHPTLSNRATDSPVFSSIAPFKSMSNRMCVYDVKIRAERLRNQSCVKAVFRGLGICSHDEVTKVESKDRD